MGWLVAPLGMCLAIGSVHGSWLIPDLTVGKNQPEGLYRVLWVGSAPPRYNAFAPNHCSWPGEKEKEKRGSSSL